MEIFIFLAVVGGFTLFGLVLTGLVVAIGKVTE